AFCHAVHAPASSPSSTLSLHDALPIWRAAYNVELEFSASGVLLGGEWLSFKPDEAIDFLWRYQGNVSDNAGGGGDSPVPYSLVKDRKSTRLNSSHVKISYAVFCLKRKN